MKLEWFGPYLLDTDLFFTWVRLFQEIRVSGKKEERKERVPKQKTLGTGSFARQLVCSEAAPAQGCAEL